MNKIVPISGDTAGPRRVVRAPLGRHGVVIVPADRPAHPTPTRTRTTPDVTVTRAVAVLRGYAKPNMSRATARTLLSLWRDGDHLSQDQQEQVLARFLAGPGEHRAADPDVTQAVDAIMEFAAPDPGMLVTYEMAEGCLRLLNRPLTPEQVDHVLDHFPRRAQ